MDAIMLVLLGFSLGVPVGAYGTGRWWWKRRHRLFGRRRTMTLRGRGESQLPHVQRMGTVDVSPVNDVLDQARERTEKGQKP